VPLIAEAKVNFSRELSIIAARNPGGEIRYYPLCENQHHDGILAHTQVCRDSALQQQAESFAERVLQKFDYVGVLTIELFDCDGKLVANEMAPRVHNSGHWSIEGATTSQFENHVRAVLDLPLGETTVLHDFHMYNLITKMPDSTELLSIPNLHLHDYNKAPAFRRKLGHLTLYPADADTQKRVESLIK
jgi:5-(carboxyamino)imidazole ribonucleotide synthase